MLLSLYNKHRINFKLNISIDKAHLHAYRTIILQAPDVKRLMIAKFFQKNRKIFLLLTPFSPAEKRR